MERIIQLILLLGLLLNTSCINKQRKFQSEATNDTKIAIIGFNDSLIDITVTDKDKLSDKDTVIYEVPGYWLWFTKELPSKYKNQDFLMWTECKVYWENVAVINVFVTNPTETPLEYGRKWTLRKLNEQGEWVTPKTRYSPIIWEQDLLIDSKAPLLYCFRFPIGEYYHLPKGIYRIGKSFALQGKKDFDLYAEFEIK